MPFPLVTKNYKPVMTFNRRNYQISVIVTSPFLMAAESKLTQMLQGKSSGIGSEKTVFVGVASIGQDTQP